MNKDIGVIIPSGASPEIKHRLHKSIRERHKKRKDACKKFDKIRLSSSPISTNLDNDEILELKNSPDKTTNSPNENSPKNTTRDDTDIPPNKQEETEMVRKQKIRPKSVEIGGEKDMLVHTHKNQPQTTRPSKKIQQVDLFDDIQDEIEILDIESADNKIKFSQSPQTSKNKSKSSKTSKNNKINDDLASSKDFDENVKTSIVPPSSNSKIPKERPLSKTLQANSNIKEKETSNIQNLLSMSVSLSDTNLLDEKSNDNNNNSIDNNKVVNSNCKLTQNPPPLPKTPRHDVSSSRDSDIEITLAKPKANPSQLRKSDEIKLISQPKEKIDDTLVRTKTDSVRKVFLPTNDSSNPENSNSGNSPSPSSPQVDDQNVKTFVSSNDDKSKRSSLVLQRKAIFESIAPAEKTPPVVKNSRSPRKVPRGHATPADIQKDAQQQQQQQQQQQPSSAEVNPAKLLGENPARSRLLDKIENPDTGAERSVSSIASLWQSKQ